MNIEPKSTVIQSEASALVVDKKKVDKSGNFAQHKGRHCDHCDKDVHSRDRCWILFPHLKPKFKGGEKIDKAAHSVTSDASDLIGQLSKILLQLFKSGPSSEPSSSTYASGNLPVFLSYTYNTCTWIVDSGATDHITNDRSSLSDFTSLVGKSVSVANGCSVPIQGCGKVEIDPGWLPLKLFISRPSHSAICWETFYCIELERYFFPNFYVRTESRGRRLVKASILMVYTSSSLVFKH